MRTNFHILLHRIRRKLRKPLTGKISEKGVKAFNDELNKDIESAYIDNEDLYQGIFWITDVDDISNNKNYCFPIESNSDGSIVNPEGYNLNAKSGLTFNHEKYWKELPNSMTNGEAFNYYPRGRVKISNGRATIYANPNICTEELKDFIISQFGLYKYNGINKVAVVPDGSSHYRCYLDEE